MDGLTLCRVDVPMQPNGACRVKKNLPWHRIALALVVVLLPWASHAQMGGHGRHNRQQSATQTTPAPPPLPPEPVVWPRLDPGAILCRTRGALTDEQNRLRDDDSAGLASGCRIVQDVTAIKILERHGPGQTQVALTDHGDETGWTNTFLPAEPRAGATVSAGR
jgi:hypothetical protein